MHRHCCFAKEASGPKIILDAQESNHLLRVHRAQIGHAVTVLDGKGTVWHTRLSSTDRHVAVLEVLHAETQAPMGPKITLAIGLPKHKILGEILRHATELGLNTLIPLATEHSEVHPHAERLEHQHERLEHIAIEACKQSGNPFLPKILNPCSLDAFLVSTAHNPSLKLYASLGPEATPNTPKGPELLWLIGPEGGFSTTEDLRIRQAGFTPVRLAPYVLRVETAALCAVCRGKG